MNESEQLKVPETNEGALKDINEGFNNVSRLAQQRARGANVGGEMEAAKEALYQRVAKAIEDLEKLATANEFGKMDGGRFEQTPWDKLKIRKEI